MERDSYCNKPIRTIVLYMGIDAGSIQPIFLYRLSSHNLNAQDRFRGPIMVAHVFRNSALSESESINAPFNLSSQQSSIQCTGVLSP